MHVGVIGLPLLIRKALATLLATTRDCRVIVDAEGVLDCIEQIRGSPPSVLLIGAASPTPALEAVSKLRAAFPKTRMLLLVEDADDEFQLKALQAGALGCIPSSTDPQMLEKALRVVDQGDFWISRNVARLLLGKHIQSETETQPASDDLTPREVEVLASVASGRCNKEIASHLNISEHTVKTHLVAVYRKLRVRSRLEAALHYFQHGERTSDDMRQFRARFGS